MKYKTLALSTLLSVSSFSAYAEDDSKHMISVDAQGLGWSGSIERMSTKDGSAFDRIDNIFTNFAFNYAYRITKRQQIGGFVQMQHNEYKFKTRSGHTSKSERDIQAFGIFALHNFSDDLSNAYYVGASLSTYNLVDEVSHDFSDAEGKAPNEIDDNGLNYELSFGKRFSLKPWGIQNITYAPQISVFYRTHGKDFDDQDVKNGMGTTIQPIKFDVLF